MMEMTVFFLVKWYQSEAENQHHTSHPFTSEPSLGSWVSQHHAQVSCGHRGNTVALPAWRVVLFEDLVGEGERHF